MPEVMWICTTGEHPVGIVKVYDEIEKRWKYYIGTGNSRYIDEDVQLIIDRGQMYYGLNFITAFEEAKAPIHRKTERDETDPFDRACYGKLKRDIYSCPRCGKALYVQNHHDRKDGSGFRRWPQGAQTPYCPQCGQALRWKKKEE